MTFKNKKRGNFRVVSLYLKLTVWFFSDWGRLEEVSVYYFQVRIIIGLIKYYAKNSDLIWTRSHPTNNSWNTIFGFDRRNSGMKTAHNVWKSETNFFSTSWSQSVGDLTIFKDVIIF